MATPDESPQAARHRARLAAQLLSERTATTPEEVAGHLLAVQAQDARGARLAVRSRSTGLTAADVDTALTERRSLVVTWLNRGTLHLVRAEDHWWLHALTNPQLAAGNERRLRQEGVAERQAARGVAVVTEAVAERPRTRADLRSLLDGAGVPTAGQALIHVIFAAARAGSVVRGPMVGAEQAFVNPVDWLGPPPEPLERPEALARLARRYLAGHGPATAADLARWAGIPLGQARAGLAAIADELGDGPDGTVDLADRPAPPPLPPPRLLGAFDPLLLGWTDRADVVGDHRGIVTSNGLFRPFALVGGRATALWSVAGGALTVRPLDRLSRSATDRLRVDGRDVLRFLGLSATIEIATEP